MALLDAYVTAAEYRARTAQKGENPVELTAQLTMGTRLLERTLAVPPGAFNTHTATYDFDAHGGTILRLRDRTGAGYFLWSLPADAIGLDTERDGTYDGFSLDFSDNWVRGLPENASATTGESFTAIEILAHLSTASPAAWPNNPASVRITGATWGYLTVPGAIKELVIDIVHGVRSAQLAGPALEVPVIEEGFTLSRDAFFRMREMKQRYGRRLPAIA